MVSWEIPELWLEFFRFFFRTNILKNWWSSSHVFLQKGSCSSRSSRVIVSCSYLHLVIPIDPDSGWKMGKFMQLLIFQWTSWLLFLSFFKHFCRSLKSFFLEYLQVKIGTIIGTTLIWNFSPSKLGFSQRHTTLWDHNCDLRDISAGIANRCVFWCLYFY